MSTDKIRLSYQNLTKGLAQLRLFLHEPVRSDRDRAGVIQAFEFIYELFWKTFQKIGASEGLIVSTPREAFKAAFQMRLIELPDEDVWLTMIDDRNLMSHTYQESTAQVIFDRIRSQYLDAFEKAYQRLHKRP